MGKKVVILIVEIKLVVFRGQVIDKIYFMAEPIYTKEVYPHNQYLNPSRHKLKSLFCKKSLLDTTGKHTRNRTLSVDKTKHGEGCCCGSQGECIKQLKEMLVVNSNMLKQIKQYLTAETPSARLAITPQHLKLLQQKNTLLEGELKFKENKIDTLRERYQELLMKFENFTVHSKHTSFNTSFDSNTNRSLSPSRKNDILRQLKRLRDRLKAINFSNIFTMINKIGIHPKT